MQCLRCHKTGHVRRECKVPRCSLCRRFGHADTQCIRLYASVAGPVVSDDVSDHLMDTTEAEDAQGTGEPVTLAGTMTTTPPNSQDAQVPGYLGRQAEVAIAVSEDEPVKGNVSCSFSEDSVLCQRPAPSTGQGRPA
ncbi:hypothetical protein HPB47_003368 [Ixodes persulcatus]|uniref:Uncharacterized protein n=1 Tax=Ixodes persulcatus TaxID=34615 RepID=A0AC60PIL5_IXOPE|nr:hypothetical protein HPB47_003368 [Ixodes persulcatus]